MNENKYFFISKSPFITMAHWSVEEILACSIVYAQSYKDAKSKIGEDGKFKNTKAQGTMGSFHNKVIQKLAEERFTRTVDSLKSKEKQFIEWHREFNRCVAQSGFGCLKGSHYMKSPPAALEDEPIAKQILENFHQAIAGSPLVDPEVHEMGNESDNEGNKLSLKSKGKVETTKRLSSAANPSDDDVFKNCIRDKHRQVKRELNSDFDDDLTSEEQNLRKLKRQKTVDLLVVEELQGVSKVFANFIAAGMNEDKAMRLAGLKGNNNK